ncbi:MAG: carboxypeptidase regulatory-like domain-containing protein, partial [Candidatus Aminicenantes bacterium]|nr:carboxypeptidase regulatory-like domain-containing protein [Candidatus Aminicenantes bacterium]
MNANGKKSRSKGKTALLLLLLSCFVLIYIFSMRPSPLFSQDTLAHGEVIVKGLSLTIPEEDKQIEVPVSTATIVRTEFTVDTPDMLAGLIVKGELRGPGLSSAVTLTTLPNHPFSIPGLPLKGRYYFENIHLERDGVVLLRAVPDRVEISVIDLIVTSVETRQLSLQEIRDRGIVITDDSFTCYNFSVGFQIESRKVTYNFPVVFNRAGVVEVFNPGVPGGGLGMIKSGPGIGGMVPFNLVIPEIDSIVPSEGGGQGTPATIPGILVFNNNIAFLNQFFSVMFIISNSASQDSSLTLKNIEAKIILPEELREAQTNPPHIVGTPIPVRCPGPDGKLGTADDLDIIMATFSGMAEFLAEGLQEGTHIVKIDFTGTLSGLASGDVEVEGTASGAVMVRNPEFSITFSHPSVVRTGEEYDIYVNITNISPVTANLVSLSMPADTLIGCSILSDESVGFETLAPGESKTAEYHMLSNRTGEVRASAFRADGSVKGTFVLRTGVGEEGIPLSPDTITLPRYAYSLPSNMINKALVLLGEAYSIATVPPGGLPENLPYVTRDAVATRILDLAEAGQRVYLGEPVLNSVEVLALDWQGNRQEDLPFDILRRLTTKGTKFAAEIALQFNQYLTGNGVPDFHEHFAETCSYKNPFASALLSFNEGPRTAVLKITDFYQNVLSYDGDSLTRDIPYGEMYCLRDDSESPVDFALMGTIDENGYTIEVNGRESGTFDLSLLVADSGDGFIQVFFSGIECRPGSRSSITVKTGTATFSLSTDLNGDGISDVSHDGEVHPIQKPGFRLIGAVQDCSAHPAGHAVALLFNCEVNPGTAKVPENFSIPGKATYGSYLQPSLRVILVGFNNPISPFVESTIKVDGLLDRDDRPLNPSPTEMPIQATIKTPGGIVYGQVLTAEGQPVTGARVQLLEIEEGDITGFDRTRSYTVTDSSGNYRFDYVRILNDPFTIEVLDPASGKIETVKSKLWSNGQRYLVNIIIRGRGNLTGRVITTAGTPVANASVWAKAENVGESEIFSTKADENGEYLISDVPIGRVNLHAASGSLYGTASASISAPGELATIDITVVGGTFGSVIGRVLQHDAITPVAGSYVVLVTGYGERAVNTDENGYFQFASVPTGKIVVKAYDPTTGKPGGLVETTLNEGQEFNASIILRGTGTISGTVLSYYGQPCEGILVFVTYTDFYMYTDNNGQFSFANVPVGGYKINAYDPVTYKQVSGSVNLAVENETTHLTLVLPDPSLGGIAGTVFQLNGTDVVSNEMVYVSDGAYRVLQQTETNDNGQYAFENLPRGHYYITAIQGNNGTTADVSIQFAGHYPTCNVTFRGKGSVDINVYANDGETGIMTQLLFAYTAFEFRPGSHIGFMMDHGTYTTDVNGHIRFDNVLTGNFGGHVSNPFYPNDVYYGGELTTPGSTESVTVVMPALGAVRGTLLSYADDSPVHGARVTMKANYLNMGPLTTDENGRFEFVLVPPGGFAVEAEIGNEADPDSMYYGRTASSMSSDGGNLELPPFHLKGKGQVTGYVKRPDDTCVPDAAVTLKTIGFPYTVKKTRTQKSDAGEPGRFTFYFIPQGSFSITALDDNGTSLGGRAGGIINTHGEEVSVDVILEESGTVQGRVFSPDGSQVLSSAQVVLYRGASGSPFGFFLSGPDGSYHFNNVKTGDFRVEVLDPVTGRRGKAVGALINDGDIAEVDVYLEGRGAVFGAFYDPRHSDPVAGAQVKIVSQGQFPFDMVTTSDSTGSFRFGEVGVGAFNLEATGSAIGQTGKAEGKIEYEGHELRVDIEAEGTGKVTGTVFQPDGQSPFAGATITLVMGNQDFMPDSNSGGVYAFNAIPLGNFTIKAVDPQQTVNFAKASGSLTYNGQELNINLTLRGTGSVTGTLEKNGIPLEGYTVYINSPYLNTSVSSGANGIFLFSEVPIGSFSLKATDPASGEAAVGSGGITNDGQEVTVNLTFEPNGRVEGTVLTTGGSEPADKAYVRLKGLDFNQYTSTNTDGNFLFDAVKLGSFTVYVEGYNQSGLARVGGTVNSGGELVGLGNIILDNLAPEVTTLFPANGSNDVPRETAIIITFSEAMTADSVQNANNVRLISGSASVGGARLLQSDQQTLVFTPSSALSSFRLYTISVGAAVQDIAGNTMAAPAVATFSTTDIEPPAVASISPVNGTTGVSPDSLIIVTFNEPVNSAVFTPANMIVSSGSVLYGGLSFNESGTVVTFTPGSPMAENSTYTVTINGVLDLVGNVQTQAFTGTFHTTDTIAPDLQISLSGGGTTVIEGSTTTIIATVTPANDVAGVYFYKDGTHMFTDGSAPYEYRFSAPLLADQGTTPILVEALAVDFAGNQSTKENLVLTLAPDNPPQVTMTMNTQSPIDVGENISCEVTVTDDTRIIQTTFSATGGIINYRDNREPSGTYFSATYVVPVPGDIIPGTDITIRFTATDSMGQATISQAEIIHVKDDIAPPTVQITSPQDGELFKFNEVINIAASAVDDCAIREVKFYLKQGDGNEELFEADTTAPYKTTYTAPPLDESLPLIIRAEAADLLGNTVSSQVTVTLSELFDEEDPVINILSPTTGSLVFPGESLKIITEATDDIDVGIARVEFFIDGQLTATDTDGTENRYEATCDIPADAAEGSTITIMAKVFDLEDNWSYDQVTVPVKSGTLLADNLTIEEGDTTYDNRTIIIYNTTVTIDGSHTFENILVKGSGVLTHSPATTQKIYKMDLTITGHVVIGPDARIGVSTCGYLGGYQGDNINNDNYGQTLNFAQGSRQYSGASYGGYGGSCDPHVINGIYGSVYEPADHGSGGGGQTSNRKGGSGGGVLKIETGGFIIDGSINSDGGDVVDYAGGGSGGSILLQVNTLKGSGWITANGGSFSQQSYGYPRAGGGGRIALYYTDAIGFDLSRVTAYGGTYSNGSCEDFKNGSAGTIYLKKAGEEGEIIINNNGLAAENDTRLITPTTPGTITAIEAFKLTDTNANFIPGSLVGMKLIPNIEKDKRFTIVANNETEILIDEADGSMIFPENDPPAQVGDFYDFAYPGNLVFDGSDTVINGTGNFSNITLIDSVVVVNGTLNVGNLTLQDGSVLTHSKTTTSETYSLTINADEIVIFEGCKISADSCGYLGGHQGDNATQYGQTLNFAQGSYQFSGAGYGGYGAQNGDVAVNEIYGSIYEPSDPGSGGGGQLSNRQGGNGGGVLKIEALELTIDGSINSNGDDVVNYAGGGSGGSILIRVNTLIGSGWVTANGGSFTVLNSYARAGGGGRIAIYCTNAGEFDLSRITAYGGTCSGGSLDSTRNGSAGTVYLKKGEEEGKLVIDNSGVDAYKPVIFPVINPGTISSFTTNTMTDDNASFMPGALVGMELQPGINDSETTFTITANTENTITVDNDLSAVATVDGSYCGKMVFPGHLIIRNTPQAQISREIKLNNLSVTQNSVLTHPYATSTSVSYLSIKAQDSVFVDSTGRIDVTSRGYLGGHQGDNSVNYGQTLNFAQGSYQFSGAGHGGYGAQNGDFAVNEIYGSIYEPFDPGSGGGGQFSYRQGGNGGGVLKIEAQELSLAGSINADGGDVVNWAGGGSGGSILIRVDTLIGSGWVTANGGSFTVLNSYARAGGGGR